MTDRVYRPPKKSVSTTVLSDERAKYILTSVVPFTRVGYTAMFWQFVRWERLHSGALGAIYAHPQTGEHHRWAVDFKTGTPRNLGPIGSRAGQTRLVDHRMFLPPHRQ